eukprot:CAMPEP_0197864826 /NCGR_PEP_ID=MMETSP1438-20131217/43311_1 /TAXON_ID=1461541 /ORGANISM="Pterosperma sp., Strain CCMP1384" /LENGTH=212 /DNA_ID=CAMNT_0043483199 /DNA_START=72 /DNA_END=709 /DNA_ORIENTATION=+
MTNSLGSALIISLLVGIAGVDIMSRMGNGSEVPTEPPDRPGKPGWEDPRLFLQQLILWGGYVQIRQMFQQRYPGVPIVGSNYEPSAQKKAIAQAVSLTSYAVMGITLGGDALFEALGMPPPTLDIYKGMIENQFYSCAGSYFIGNTVAAVCKLDPKASLVHDPDYSSLVHDPDYSSLVHDPDMFTTSIQVILFFHHKMGPIFPLLVILFFYY